jgi:hypothetical protein
MNMNRFYRLMVFVIFWSVTSSVANAQDYYYAFDKKIYLDVHPTKAIVRFKAKGKGASLLLGAKSLWQDDRTAVINFENGADRDQFIARSSAHKDVLAISPLRVIGGTMEAGLTDEILTSASAAEVSGVAALVLSIIPI